MITTENLTGGKTPPRFFLMQAPLRIFLAEMTATWVVIQWMNDTAGTEARTFLARHTLAAAKQNQWSQGHQSSTKFNCLILCGTRRSSQLPLFLRCFGPHLVIWVLSHVHPLITPYHRRHNLSPPTNVLYRETSLIHGLSCMKEWQMGISRTTAIPLFRLDGLAYYIT